jgi:hypothetical protein
MTRTARYPGFDTQRVLDRISLAALCLLDEEQEPQGEAINAWLRQHRLRTITEPQYQEWLRLGTTNEAVTG